MKQRLLTALFLIGVFLPALVLGKILFSLVVLLTVFFVEYEILKINHTVLPISIFTYLLTLFYLYSYNYLNLELELVFSIYVLVLFTYHIFDQKFDLLNLFLLVTMFVYFLSGANSVIALRKVSAEFLIYPISLALICDSSAMIIGINFGRHKLAPTISPKKSVEGAIGALVVGTIYGSIYNYCFGLEIPYIIFISLVLAIASQLGDLCMSAIKRYFKIKDFSNLLPGHGGLLDRIDSLLFCCIVFVFICKVLKVM